MRFDSSFVPVRSGLPAAIASAMDRAFYSRRAAGFNVQFIRETDGLRDEFSFGDASRRDAFIASLQRRNVACVTSN